MIPKQDKRLLLRIIVPKYPTFNIYSFISEKMTSLGPVCVASAVNEMAGWDVEVIDENNLRRHGPRAHDGGADHALLQRERPADVIGLYGGLTSTIPRLYELASWYKNHGALIIAGGQHFVDETIEEAFDNKIDYVVLGEGEIAIRELISAVYDGVSVGSVRGIVYKKEGRIVRTDPRQPLQEFHMLPLPDYGLVRYAKIDIYPIERIRGCGMDCEFCTVKGKPRCSSPERGLAIVQSLVEKYNARLFFVVDDLFGQERTETLRFCSLLRDYQKRIGKQFGITVQIRLDKGHDDELMSAMREAGIDHVCIGFESPIPEELAAMRKHLKIENLVALSRMFHNVGFLVHGMFIFAYPLLQDQIFRMSSEQRIGYYRRFIKKAKIDTIQVLLPVPLPGTELRARLKMDGRIFSRECIGWEYYDGNFPLFEQDPPLTPVAAQRAIRKIMGKFYQFKYMFMIGVSVFSFIGIIFFPHNIKLGWWRWYRHWRNNLIRFGGSITIKKWTGAVKKDRFIDKIRRAQTRQEKKEGK